MSEPHSAEAPADRASADRGTRPPFATVAVILVGSVIVSWFIPAARRAFGGEVPPLFALLDPETGVGLVAVTVLGVIAYLGIPRVLVWGSRRFLIAVVLFGWLFSGALAAQAGLDDLTEPFLRPLDYYVNVPRVDEVGPGKFGELYPALGDRLSLHARTHPPGGVLFLWGLSKVTGGSVLAVSLIVALVGALGAVPTYHTARYVWGERAGRYAAILFVAAPGVLLFSATSMDAVFMTLIAAALAALVRAPTSGAWAAVAGGLGSIAMAFTFGAAALGLVGIWIGLFALVKGASFGRRVSRPLMLVRGLLSGATLALGASVIKVLAGIDLVASFEAAAAAHSTDPSRGRSFTYWAFANILAFLLIAGIPQSSLLVAETRIRWARRSPGLESVLWGSVVVATATGQFLGEVDHIWLFFLPLVAAAGGIWLARLSPKLSSPPYLRPMVAISLGQAVVMEVLLDTFW